ncbi:hypothetical protein FRC14_002447 [Serendipita sp. 396]|nr:hypothetical protein FRC14_002447 [Serendipita sp. 396]KAG8800371.1 hypothetical protein FRC16_003044 [Serendipita sp. 398]
MDAQELARWTRFAAKGGIGKCTGNRDCVAQNPEDLMFLQDDEIVVLMQVSSSDNLYLGFCEGVVGKFSGTDVRFHGKLKKPIITRRPGSVTASATNSPALSGRPIASSPTPSDPSSSSPFHLDRPQTSTDHHTNATSEPGHSHSGPATSSFGHGHSSLPNTRPSTADKSPGSAFSFVEIPARPSDDQPARVVAIDVHNVTGRQSYSPPHQDMPQRNASPLIIDEKAKASATETFGVSPLVRFQETSPVVLHTSTPSGTLSIQELGSAASVEAPGSRDDEPHATDMRIISPTALPDANSDHSKEPSSPASQYTREGGIDSVSVDSHVQRTSTLTVSDGGFGIGLSLLQGLANRDTDSKYWSESEADTDLSAQKPTKTLPEASTPGKTREAETAGQAPTPKLEHQRGSLYSYASSGGRRKMSVKSESDMGDDGNMYDDDDIFDDYRYSRYSTSSAKQSRNSVAQSIAALSSKAPPLPEDANTRPSLESQVSLRSAPSASSPPVVSIGLSTPKPLNIIKNTGRAASPSSPPTTPMPPPDQDRATSTSITPLGIASAMRERIDKETALKVVDPLDALAKMDITPKPSLDGHMMPSASVDTVQPSTSGGYNGDESETDNSSEADQPFADVNGPLSPASTYASTSSVFLPHPGAPKPVITNGQIEARQAAIHVANAAGPGSRYSMVVSSSPEAQHSTFSMPAVMSLVSTLAMAAARARSVKATTVYATTQVDLLSSPVPVPISFSVDGHPPSPHVPEPEMGFPRQPLGVRPSGSPVGLGISPVSPKDDAASPSTAIPRANFFPKAGVPRPRSRSFSGFSVSDAEVLIPSIERNREEGSRPSDPPDRSDYRSSLRDTSPQPPRAQTSPSSRARSPSRGPSRAQRPAHVPSPLSLPAIVNPVNADEQIRDLSSPVQQNGHNSGRLKGLRQVASSGVLRSGGLPFQGENVGRNDIPPSRISNEKLDNSPLKPAPSRRSTSTNQPDDERSELTTPSLVTPGVSSSASSPIVRSVSVRSKLSMSALRAKGTNGRPSRDGDNPPFSNISPITPGQDDDERVQIQDMEFELVKPVLKTSGLQLADDFSPRITSPGEVESVRSGFSGTEAGVGPWRAESPAHASTSHIRSPNANSSSKDSLQHDRVPNAMQAALIEAHRTREQKWMSLISSTPSSQARKSKKVKRLILEGVPSSVRGRVWDHVTDSRARRMEGLFTQLIKKAPKQIVPLIEQDIERCFPDHPHLRDPRGSLANLLLAYTAMVPDIRYRTGLTRIAGHLLLQAPDEDAFWIFVAVMDAHLRGYYHASSTGQFEIDAALFQSLVESVESELAHLLFNEFRLRPIDICGTWFSCIFAGILPPEHLYRVWDVLFYEGPIYLFRVGLALLTLCKRQLMNIASTRSGPEAAMELLGRPPPSVIPQEPESFISHTFTVKVRDDDLRKQRAKRESQWKKDRLAQR